MLIPDNGVIKTLTGHKYEQKALFRQITAIKVGIKIKSNTTKPDTDGLATNVVEKVDNIRKKNKRNQLFLSLPGHFRNFPK